MASDKITYDMLIAYAAGELTEDEAGRIKVHLICSPEDTARVERMRATIQTLRTDDSVAPPGDALARDKAVFSPPEAKSLPSWLELLERVVAKLVFDSRSQEALVGVRGADDGLQLAYESEVAEVDLEALPSAAGRLDGWTIMGQISPHQPTAEVFVALVSHSDQVLLGETRPDPHGVFKLHVDTGVYDLAIRVSDRVLVLQEITLNWSRFARLLDRHDTIPNPRCHRLAATGLRRWKVRGAPEVPQNPDDRDPHPRGESVGQAGYEQGHVHGSAFLAAGSPRPGCRGRPRRVGRSGATCFRRSGSPQSGGEHHPNPMPGRVHSAAGALTGR
jgi:hypothetical protein